MCIPKKSDADPPRKYRMDTCAIIESTYMVYGFMQHKMSRQPKTLIILAGGYGTRISEETSDKPKPMIMIGEKPIIWHLMKYYSTFGVENFIICCGYKGYIIKEYFLNYKAHNSSLTIDISSNSIEYHSDFDEKWKITLLETGLHSMTGGRLRAALEFSDDESFYFTYGDGLSNVNLHELRDFHSQGSQLVTMTAVQPQGRFGSLVWSKDNTTEITNFREKPKGDGAWINGGFFVLQREVLCELDSYSCVWEGTPLMHFASSGQLMAFRHSGFWYPMDTLRDKIYLNELWNKPNCPWKNW